MSNRFQKRRDWLSSTWNTWLRVKNINHKYIYLVFFIRMSLCKISNILNKCYLKSVLQYLKPLFDLCSQVERRYSDFAAMYELILQRYRCRLIPKLPPKNIGAMVVGVKSGLVGERRRALKRWLSILVNHPIISIDPVIQVYLYQIIFTI